MLNLSLVQAWAELGSAQPQLANYLLHFCHYVQFSRNYFLVCQPCGHSANSDNVFVLAVGMQCVRIACAPLLFGHSHGLYYILHRIRLSIYYKSMKHTLDRQSFDELQHVQSDRYIKCEPYFQKKMKTDQG